MVENKILSTIIHFVGMTTIILILENKCISFGRFSVDPWMRCGAVLSHSFASTVHMCSLKDGGQAS